MVLQLADGFSSNYPANYGFKTQTGGIVGKSETALQRLDATFKRIEALKSLPVVGNAIALIGGLVAGNVQQERQLFAAVYNQAKNVEVYNWWKAQGKTGDPYAPLTLEKVEWLTTNLTNAAQTMANRSATSTGGQKRVDQRWAKAYADLATDIANDARRLIDSPVMGYGKWIAVAIGGLALTYFLTRRK
jgi:hypothetical protein